MRPKAIASWFGVPAVRMLPFLLGVIFPCSLTLAADDGAALPRYRLEIGQELVYQRTADDEPQEANDAKNEKSKAARSEMEWRIFVVRQNDDGSWRLYIRTKIKIVNRDGIVRRRWDSLGYCDLHPDGTYSMDEQTAIFKRLLPYEYFCRLPDTSAALVDGWQYAPPVDGKVFTYRLAQRDRAHLQIVGIQHDAYSEAAKWQITKAYDFDTQRGLVISIADELKDLAADQMSFPDVGASTVGLLSSPGAQGCLLTASALYAGRIAFNHRSITRLTSSARRDSAWLARFDEEAQRYLDVHTKWMTLCYAGVRAHSVEASKAVRLKARRLLVAGREHAQLDIFQELYDATINSHDDEEKGHEFAVKEREEFFAVVPGFSTTWEAKNLDGSRFRLADQRGKVLVLYFWTTGCEYNVLAAPQICQLAADYQGNKDVAIVGMFIRSQIADEETKARYFIAKCLHGFPHLEANEIAALYHFRQYRLGCPTTMVLDQRGRVHEVQAGYSDDLAQYIRKIVDDLRGKPPAKSD